MSDEKLRAEVGRIVNDWYADGLLCIDDPGFHVPLADRLADLIAARLSRVEALCDRMDEGFADVSAFAIEQIRAAATDTPEPTEEKP